MVKSESWIVTVDETTGDVKDVISKIEMDKYAIKADVDPATGSKQTPSDHYAYGITLIDPKYNPYNLIELLDLYSYHADCVDAVATDASGVDYTLKPIEGKDEVESEKERFTEILDNSKPSINIHIHRMIYDRRSIGYGAMEVIRESTSKSPITRLKHIPSHTLRRHTDMKRVLYTDDTGKKVWYVLYGKNYDDDGNPCDIHADTGEFHPYNSLSMEEKANELLWTMEYAPGTNYYGRPPIIATLPSIQSDLAAVRYNTTFFQNYGMPAFAVTVTGDFQDYGEEKYIKDDDGREIPNPNYDEKQTLRYQISQQVKEVIRNPHSAICITVPSEGVDGNVEIKITQLSVDVKEGSFRMMKKDIRDEVIHAHQVDPSRLGIFDSGNLNGTNSEVTKASYKYGTIAPIKTEVESMINQIAAELEVTSWKFVINDVDPIDHSPRKELADFLFARGAMTIMDLINNFGDEFGLAVDDPNDPYLNSRFINNVPLEQVFNQSEQNSYLEEKSILKALDGNLWQDSEEDDDFLGVNNDTGIGETD